MKAPIRSSSSGGGARGRGGSRGSSGGGGGRGRGSSAGRGRGGSDGGSFRGRGRGGSDGGRGRGGSDGGSFRGRGSSAGRGRGGSDGGSFRGRGSSAGRGRGGDRGSFGGRGGGESRGGRGGRGNDNRSFRGRGGSEGGGRGRGGYGGFKSNRGSSPTGSDFELDITSALADASDSDEDMDDLDDDEVEAKGPRPVKRPRIDDLDAANIFDDIVGGGDSDDGDDDETFIAAQQLAQNRKGAAVKGKGGVKKGGGFQAMGLNHTLLKAIARKGFNVPTPIQRKTIPLLMEGLDVVGMARTGSGKTAAFVIPMIEKLKTHSIKVGARALIMSPSRELALQTLKVVKEFGKGTDLKCVLLVGGDSLEDQFGFMASNPDIIIATPGRFLHLKVEMELDLRSIQYVVFDEADRLFEMGFSAQLTEILYTLPPTRQTLLFSATLPKSLVDFAKAGLQEPSLIRLDADSKISQDLEAAFFSVKSSEKEGALLHLIQDVIKVPKQSEEAKRDMERRSNMESDNVDEDFDPKDRKRKRQRLTSGATEMANHATIVFVATKHHVEYLARLISLCGYAVSYVYGALDQTARRNQVNNFRSGDTQILIVTDVAARGIDIPILANVINFDFPPQPKVFVHRVGRTARAGKKGWAYSLIRAEDAPYLLDLQLFLGRKLVFADSAENVAKKSRSEFNFATDVVIGGLIRDSVERCVERINTIIDEDPELDSLRGVAVKGERLYNKTKPAAAVESIKRAKEVVSKKAWGLVNPLFIEENTNMEEERTKMLARLSAFRPPETIFEIGQRGLHKNEAAEVMRQRRQKITIGPRKKTTEDGEDMDWETDEDGDDADNDVEMDEEGNPTPNDDDDNSDSEDEGTNLNKVYDSDSDTEAAPPAADMTAADEIDLATGFRLAPRPKLKPKKPVKKPRKSTNALNPASFHDQEHFMSYLPSGTTLAEDRGYSIHNAPRESGTSFAEQARNATLDLSADLGDRKHVNEAARGSQHWDRKSKKFVNNINDEDGSRGARLIVGESGQKIAASFKSGRFDAWKQKNKINRVQRVGEIEDSAVARRAGAAIIANQAARSSGPSEQLTGGATGRPMGGRQGGRMFHSTNKAAKAPDRFRDDYHAKKNKLKAAQEGGTVGEESRKKGGWGAASGQDRGGAGKGGVKTKDQIRKDMKLLQRRKEKTNRPARKGDERRPFKARGGMKSASGGGGRGGGGGGGRGGRGGKR